jgi:hypothetical protein
MLYRTSNRITEQVAHVCTYAAYAYDAEREGRLWRDSLKLVGFEEEQ